MSVLWVMQDVYLLYDLPCRKPKALVHQGMVQSSRTEATGAARGVEEGTKDLGGFRV